MISSERFSCPECGSLLRAKREHRYPGITTLIFGASFAAFLMLQSRFNPEIRGPYAWPRSWLWIWSVIQVALGVVLVRKRIRAQKVVYHCIRCSPALTSKPKQIPQ